ncbi:hypothetical protein PPYR_05213 [Photinus pyralis]|uniref:Uncharacterized protein n=1 Tax=Photinus pyralis TaxID=7054 RepID=A0A5N4B097_PHOPY|nr:hypothetical protein PPYR_05213 [Photinus pyralis]
MLSHPGRTLSIYALAPICMKAWDRSATPSNIKSGFRCTGIWPFDKNVFREEDFLCSFVTGRTAPPTDEFLYKTVDAPLPSTSSAQSLPEPQMPVEIEYNQNFVSPSKIRPKEKISIIATDTPERDQIAEKKLMKERPPIDQNKIDKAKRNFTGDFSTERGQIAEKKLIKKRPPINQNKIEKTKRQIMSDSSSDEEEVIYKDSSSDLDLEQDENEDENLTKLEVHSFVICKVFGKKTVDIMLLK